MQILGPRDDRYDDANLDLRADSISHIVNQTNCESVNICKLERNFYDFEVGRLAETFGTQHFQ